MKYKVAIINKYTLKEESSQFFEEYTPAHYFAKGAELSLRVSESHNSYIAKLTETMPREWSCSCPIKKNDGSPFDGVSYYCPLHGR